MEEKYQTRRLNIKHISFVRCTRNAIPAGKEIRDTCDTKNCLCDGQKLHQKKIFTKTNLDCNSNETDFNCLGL